MNDMLGETMSRIDVTPDGKKFKILVNFVQRGAILSSPSLANKMAKRLHNSELPNAELHLVEESIEV